MKSGEKRLRALLPVLALTSSPWALLQGVSAFNLAGSVLRMSADSGKQSSPSEGTPKEKLLGLFRSSSPDSILVSPEDKMPLVKGRRQFGMVSTLTQLEVQGGSSNGDTYTDTGVYIDFVQGKGSKPWQLSREEVVQELTFQSPLTSYLYERGWRQSFNANGFPGVDDEFKEIEAFFTGDDAGVDSGEGVVLDVSCGSGLMTRKFAASKRFKRVIGADLSPVMLGETAQRFRREKLPKPELLRANVCELPIKDEALNFVHAGAALHCWTQLDTALSEIYRVLAPGGRFFATTFLTEASMARAGGESGFHFFTIEELERVMAKAGFAEVDVRKEGRACAIVKCTKSAAAAVGETAEAVGDAAAPVAEAVGEKAAAATGAAVDALEEAVAPAVVAVAGNQAAGASETQTEEAPSASAAGSVGKGPGDEEVEKKKKKSKKNKKKKNKDRGPKQEERGEA